MWFILELPTSPSNNSDHIFKLGMMPIFLAPPPSLWWTISRSHVTLDLISGSSFFYSWEIHNFMGNWREIWAQSGEISLHMPYMGGDDSAALVQLLAFLASALASSKIADTVEYIQFTNHWSLQIFIGTFYYWNGSVSASVKISFENISNCVYQHPTIFWQVVENSGHQSETRIDNIEKPSLLKLIEAGPVSVQNKFTHNQAPFL